jgi:hypothetical protein
MVRGGIHNPNPRKFLTLLTKTGCSHSGFSGVFDDSLCSYIGSASLYLNSGHNTVTRSNVFVRTLLINSSACEIGATGMMGQGVVSEYQREENLQPPTLAAVFVKWPIQKTCLCTRLLI